MNLSDFIPFYLPIEDENSNFGEKLEFRELALQPDEMYPKDPFFRSDRDKPFFRNDQMLVARVTAPWTGINMFLDVMDAGMGKSRAALAFVLMQMKYSHHKYCISLSPGKTTSRAITNEVSKYFGIEEIIQAKTFGTKETTTTGIKKSHGADVSRSRQVLESGFEKNTLISFMNSIIGYVKPVTKVTESDITGKKKRKKPKSERKDWEDYLDDTEKWVPKLREQYKNYSFIIDEVHEFSETDKNKKSWRYLIALIDAIRDICPFIFLTATPIINTWKDFASLVSMMYEENIRRKIKRELEDFETYPSTEEAEEIAKILSPYIRGKMIRRTAGDILPKDIPLSQNLFGEDISKIKFKIIGTDGSETQISESLYFVFASDYQLTSIANLTNPSDEEDITDELMKETPKLQAAYSIERQYYEFTPPIILDKSGKIRKATVEELVIYDPINHTYSPAPPLHMLDEEGNRLDYNVFEVYVLEDGSVDTTRGLGKHGPKIAELILLLETPLFQDKGAFIHTKWVDSGTKYIAAALVQRNYTQYAGLEKLTIPRKNVFAIIHGKGVSETNITNIIDAANHNGNRQGQILRLVIGSEKAGISISFINYEIFVEMSPSFNKAERIQSRGRVFRTNTQYWKPKSERKVYTVNMVILEKPTSQALIADIKKGEIRNKIYPADNPEEPSVNPMNIEIIMYKASEIKNIIGDAILKKIDQVTVEGLCINASKIDTSTHSLIYGSEVIEKRKLNIIDNINKQWHTTIDTKNMYDMKSIADMISHHTIVPTKYGMFREIQLTGNIVSTYSGGYSSLSNIYDKAFFVANDQVEYGENQIKQALSKLKDAPTEEYEFNKYISSSSLSDIKMILFELCLSERNINNKIYKVSDIYRNLILDLYNSFWTALENNKIIHILWYIIKSGSYLPKQGLSAIRQLKTRILNYNPIKRTSDTIWRYVDSLDKEIVYLSSVSGNIYIKEEEIRKNAKDYGYFVQFSLSDGIIRLRDLTSSEDQRKSRLITLDKPEASIILSKIMPENYIIPSDIEELSRDLYYRSKNLNILIIR